MAEFGNDSALRALDGRPLAPSENRPSTVRLPQRPSPEVRTIFDFFIDRFPRIDRAIWEERFGAGKVWAKDQLIDIETPYKPLLEVHYRREVQREPPVRQDYRVVWSDCHLMVVDKPPNLPVTPGGKWVRGCLLHLLLEATGNRNIVPLHRLDRLTSGVMILSLDPVTRSHFSGMLQPTPVISKTYTAVCELQRDPAPEILTFAHHISRSPNEYWRQVVRKDLPTNSFCRAEITSVKRDLALVRIWPTTGRKHQIRVQLAHEGLPILGDPLYGSVRSNDPYDLTQRLWLDAHRLAVDHFPGPEGFEPLTGDWMSSRPPMEFLQRAMRWRESVR